MKMAVLADFMLATLQVAKAVQRSVYLHNIYHMHTGLRLVHLLFYLIRTQAQLIVPYVPHFTLSHV